MTKEEALHRVKGYLTDIIPVEDYSEVEEIIKALKQEPSGDLISKQAVLDNLSELNAISFYEAQEDSKEAYYEIRRLIKNMTPVNPQEQKTGHWIEIRCDMYKCSECDFVYTDLSGERYGMHYCPNCGCRMESEVNNG